MDLEVIIVSIIIIFTIGIPGLILTLLRAKRIKYHKLHVGVAISAVTIISNIAFSLTVLWTAILYSFGPNILPVAFGIQSVKALFEKQWEPTIFDFLFYLVVGTMWLLFCSYIILRVLEHWFKIGNLIER